MEKEAIAPMGYLFWQIGKIYIEMEQAILMRERLRTGEYHCLRVLEFVADGITQIEVAHKAGQPRMYVSLAMQSLETMGYVKRAKGDKNSKLCWATQSGKNALARLKGEMEALDKRVFWALRDDLGMSEETLGQSLANFMKAYPAIV